MVCVLSRHRGRTWKGECVYAALQRMSRIAGRRDSRADISHGKRKLGHCARRTPSHGGNHPGILPSAPRAALRGSRASKSKSNIILSITGGTSRSTEMQHHRLSSRSPANYLRLTACSSCLFVVPNVWDMRSQLRRSSLGRSDPVVHMPDMDRWRACGTGSGTRSTSQPVDNT